MVRSCQQQLTQLQVYKMPPNLNRSEFSPPQNWRINGTLIPDYQCGPPVQVVCNITKPKGASPKCCVSFSAYYNESIVPCKTCACGCPSNTGSRACSATAPALLLPARALLVPFENRTALTTTWAGLKHRKVSNPLPCGDNCGISINWHLYSDYSRGWSARVTVTVFNWDEIAFPDWFTAVQLDNASHGFEKAYSFNGSALELNGVNNTIFLQGLPGLNYLVGETDGAKPERGPRVPGKEQSVNSFAKKTTPGINVAAGDGFPTKVFFNGEECALPYFRPSDRRTSQSNIPQYPNGQALSFLIDECFNNKGQYKLSKDLLTGADTLS